MGDKFFTRVTQKTESIKGKIKRFDLLYKYINYVYMCFKNMFLTAHLMKMKQDIKGSVSKLNEDQLIQRKNG